MSASPDDEIDPDAPLTPYRQLVEIIRARIARGDWAPGRRMSSETQLVQQYGIARSTVRRAIAVLVEEGDVFVVPQRGTFVAKASADEAP
ncbi:winged helix-turn-helix domain-containing protein [Streptomyces sp. NPDC006261]|uniref:winged helix-turn-helix domain-containing protein n=1 Tax=Streptomyces sp. NPDC006261 TaxID=3156739 RepID=UPI0033BF077E